MPSTVFGLKVYMASALGLSVWSERVAGVGFVDRSNGSENKGHSGLSAWGQNPQPLFIEPFKYPHKYNPQPP